jgi:hypothetical protein
MTTIHHEIPLEPTIGGNLRAVKENPAEICAKNRAFGAPKMKRVQRQSSNFTQAVHPEEIDSRRIVADDAAAPIGALEPEAASQLLSSATESARQPRRAFGCFEESPGSTGQGAR